MFLFSRISPAVTLYGVAARSLISTFGINVFFHKPRFCNLMLKIPWKMFSCEFFLLLITEDTLIKNVTTACISISNISKNVIKTPVPVRKYILKIDNKDIKSPWTTLRCFHWWLWIGILYTPGPQVELTRGNSKYSKWW